MTQEIVSKDFWGNHAQLINGTVRLNPDCPFEVWEKGITDTINFQFRSQKVLADLFIAGEALYGERAYQIIDPFNYSFGTLEKAISIRKNVAKWYDDLSFHHHTIVAKLPPDKQVELLEKASKENLSASVLNEMVNPGSADRYFLKQARNLLKYLEMHDPRESSMAKDWGIVLAELEGFSRRIDPVG